MVDQTKKGSYFEGVGADWLPPKDGDLKMAHKVETMAYAGETPWHGLGFRVEHDLTPEEMLKAGRLDWKVSKRPLWTAAGPESDEPSVRVPGQFALCRDTDQKVLSVVGKGYNPVQNADAMDFFKKFVDAGHMRMETCGALDGGRYVWGLAKIDASFNVGRADKVEGYLLMSSPHVIAKSLIMQFTPIRVVCWNTLSMALGAGLKGNVGAFRMPHSMVFNDDTRATAEIALGLATDQLKAFKEQSQVLADVKISHDDAMQYFWDVSKLKRKTPQHEPEVLAAGAANVNAPVVGDKLPKLLERFELALTQSPGATLATAKGTLWGAFNAVTYVADHQLGRTQDSRLTNAWFGDVAAMKRRALDLALERVAA